MTFKMLVDYFGLEQKIINLPQKYNWYELWELIPIWVKILMIKSLKKTKELKEMGCDSSSG